MHQQQSSPSSKSYAAPYTFAILSNVCFILAQFIAKMQTSLVSPIFIIYYRSFLMVIFNSYLIYRVNRQTKQNINNLNDRIRENMFSPSPRKQYQESQVFDSTTQRVDLANQIISLDISNRQTLVLMMKRVFFSCLSMIFYIMALKNIELSITCALFETGVIFAFYMEAFYNMKLKTVHFKLAFCSIIGLLFLLFPEFHKSRVSEPGVLATLYKMLPYFLPLLSAFTQACSTIYKPKLKQKVHTLLTNQYLMFGAIIACGVFLNFQGSGNIINSNISTEKIFFYSIFDFWFIGSSIIMMALMFLCQYLRVKSLFSISDSRIALLNYFGLGLSILFDQIVFGYNIKWYQYIGMALVCCGLFAKVLIEKQQKSEKQTEK